VICLFFASNITNVYSDEFFKLENEISTNSWSVGLSIDEDNLYVADGIGNKIQVFDYQGKFIRSFSLEDDSDCTGHIHGISIHKNLVYVVKENHDCVGIYNIDGELVHKFGSKGNEMGEFSSPQNIEIYNERIYVTDNKNKRIQIFDLKGNFMNLFNIQKDILTNGMETPYDLEIYGEQIYVTLPKEDKIDVYDLEGNFIKSIKNLESFRDPLGITIVNDQIYLASGDENEIFVLNLDGKFIDRIRSDFFDPHQIILFNDKLYVLDTRNMLVKIFTSIKADENKLSVTGDYELYFLIGILIITIFFVMKRTLLKK
jgi:DNA-binding beta-propeller fold protein YncE